MQRPLYVQSTVNKKKILRIYTGKMEKTLEKSGNFVSPKKWEPSLMHRLVFTMAGTTSCSPQSLIQEFTKGIPDILNFRCSDSSGFESSDDHKEQCIDVLFSFISPRSYLAPKLGLIHTEYLLLHLRCHFDYIIFSFSIHTERWQMSANIKANHR